LECDVLAGRSEDRWRRTVPGERVNSSVAQGIQSLQDYVCVLTVSIIANIA